jgi:hypothetical protein
VPVDIRHRPYPYSAVIDGDTYERDRPELHSEEAKRRKVAGYARARKRGSSIAVGTPITERPYRDR